MARKSRQVETRMVAEYLLKEYAAFPTMSAVPLGVVSSALMTTVGYQKAINLSRPYRYEADALVIMPRYLLLIEAKVWSAVDGLSKLPLYKSLVPQTPELKQYMPREILMQLVVIQSNPNLETMALSLGVEIKTYAPAWLLEVMAGLNKYWTPEYRAARQQKLDMQKYFGVE